MPKKHLCMLGCGRPVLATDLCSPHYHQIRYWMKQGVARTVRRVKKVHQWQLAYSMLLPTKTQKRIVGGH